MSKLHRDFEWMDAMARYKRIDVSTTMIYTHVLKVAGRGVISPLDKM